jgi:hypothetical protein
MRTIFVVALTFANMAYAGENSPHDWLTCAVQIKRQLTSGDHRAAIQTVERCQSSLQPVSGQDYLTFLSNAGLAYGESGQTEKAIRIKADLLSQTQQLYHSRHPDVVDAKLGLAVAHMYANDLNNALPLLVDAAAASGEPSFPDPNLALRVNRTLASTYDMLGDTARALPLAKRALATAESMRIDPQELSFFQTELGIMLLKSADKRAALPLLLSAYQARRNVAPAGNYGVANSAHNLALAYQAICNLAQSERLFSEAYEWRRKNIGEAHPATVRSKEKLDVVRGSRECEK